jgi:histidinol-phosphate aminotransferase
MLAAVQAPYALATPVVECVEDALQADQLETASAVVAEIVAERARLVAAFASYPFIRKVWPSDANFLLVRVDDANRVMDRCAEHKILLRHFGGDLDDCIRISIGSAAENDQLLRAFDLLREECHG